MLTKSFGVWCYSNSRACTEVERGFGGRKKQLQTHKSSSSPVTNLSTCFSTEFLGSIGPPYNFGELLPCFNRSKNPKAQVCGGYSPPISILGTPVETHESPAHGRGGYELWEWYGRRSASDFHTSTADEFRMTDRYAATSESYASSAMVY